MQVNTSKHKVYIGDGVYAQVNDYGVVTLTTEDGVTVIYLEPNIIRSLITWYKEQTK